MNGSSCRLCLSKNDNSHINIFSVNGIEMGMSDIISTHFSCEISETDLMPKFVCKSCWCITETFHELYLKSKSVQEKYLNSLIKVEPDAGDVWQNQKEDSIFCDELQIDVKSETNTDDDRSDDFQNDYNGLDGENREASENEEHIHEGGAQHGKIKGDESTSELNVDLRSTENTPTNKKPPRLTSRKRASLEKHTEFNEIFAQHKHWFDMKCDECTTEFQTFDEARRHYASEHDNPKGYIRCCGSKHMFPSQIKYHLKQHLDPKSLTYKQCNICGKRYAHKGHLIAHMKRHTGERNKEEQHQKKFIEENFDLKCDFCDTIFMSLYDARDHYKNRHNEDKGYIKCCGKKLRDPPIIRDHVKFHLNPDAFKCDLCSKQLPTSHKLGQHKRQHRFQMNKPFICDFCGKAYTDKPAIKQHLFTNHVQSEPKFECEICHKKFQLKNLLRNHNYIVHTEKKRNATCEVCGKSFYTKFHLDKHIKTHKIESERLTEQIQCEYCGEWLQTKSGIFYHQQIHTSGVQKCQHCQMELANRVALLGHIRQYHREKKFKCRHCDKSYSIRSLLRSHEERHTRHNVYPCKFCSRTFNIRESQKTHMRRNHPEELKQSKNALK